MASVIDVGEAVLREQARPLDTYRLQKLVYYCQAFHLAKHSEPLFRERIEAWANGPAVPLLYNKHRGAYKVTSVGGNPEALSAQQMDSVRQALRLYGRHSSQWLVTQTHVEAPWKDARRGLKPDQRGKHEIAVEAIRAYYTPILNDVEAEAALAEIETEQALTPDEIRERYDA